MNEVIGAIVRNLIRAWGGNAPNIRKLIATGVALMFGGLGTAIYVDAQHLRKELGYLSAYFAGAGMLVLMVIAAQEEVRAKQKVEQQLQEVEQKARENPERPEYAWDLARTKLERYLDRNLYEVRAIFFLTTTVMLGGFGLVIYGLVRAFSDPTSLPVSIVSAASGVILSFIGGSFMLIYRSVLAQSASYVSILERINAVGMAVQIASSLDDVDVKQKAETTSTLAKQLLTMYGLPQTPTRSKPTKQ